MKRLLIITKDKQQMKFSLKKSIEVLERTPLILKSYLVGLSDDWLKCTEGKNTWSPYDIIGHLIYGEKTDWMVRIKITLNDSENKTFEPYDRFAQLKNDQTIPIMKLLLEFSELRVKNIQEFKNNNP